MFKASRISAVAILCVAIAAGAAQGQRQAVPDSVRIVKDLPYTGSGNPKHTLDLYLPQKIDKPLPVVVYIHGGGWKNGNKDRGGRWVTPFVETGKFAGAAINYRLSGEATWPAQIHDCKAALRWLRGNAKRFQLDPDKIAVIGTSAGGHLVSVLGVTNDEAEVEGNLGEHLKQSSRVTCVIDCFGPSDLRAKPGAARKGAGGAIDALLGGAAADKPEFARQASPVAWASAKSAPFLMLHGTKDPLVPYQGSVNLRQALLKAGAKPAPILIPVEDAGHGWPPNADVQSRIRQFLNIHLLGLDDKVSTAPVTTAAARTRAAGQGNRQGQPVSKEQRVNDWLRTQDSNSDGQLSREESQGLMRRYFDRNDANSNGLLDRVELEALADRLSRQSGATRARGGNNGGQQ